MSARAVPLTRIAGVALIAGLQDKGFIEGGGWRADRQRTIQSLRAADGNDVGDRYAWVAEAMALLGFQGEALGVKLAGIADGEDLAVAALLFEEADQLEAELAALGSGDQDA